jgi:hypothetical protein
MYAAAGGLSLARRQARRQLDRRRPEPKQQAPESHDPPYRPPSKPLPPIRSRHSQQLEVESLKAELLDRPACSRLNDRVTSSDTVDVSAEVGQPVTEVFWKSRMAVARHCASKHGPILRLNMSPY